MSRVPRRPCAGRILSRFGQKVTCATARPTCRMQSALSCICQSTKTARGGTRQRTAHVERQSTRTHVHMTLFQCQNRTVWVLAQRTADHFLQHRMRTSSTCSHTDTFASLQSAVLSCLFCLRSGLAPIKPHINEATLLAGWTVCFRNVLLLARTTQVNSCVRVYTRL